MGQSHRPVSIQDFRKELERCLWVKMCQMLSGLHGVLVSQATYIVKGSTLLLYPLIGHTSPSFLSLGQVLLQYADSWAVFIYLFRMCACIYAQVHSPCQEAADCSSYCLKWNCKCSALSHQRFCLLTPLIIYSFQIEACSIPKPQSG